MNTIKNTKHCTFFILFSIYCMIATSCEKKTKENKENKKKEITTHFKVSELVLTQIAESNLKIVAIAQKAQEGKLQNSTRTVLEEVENDHIQLKNKIREIAKDNFIIIPNTLYDTTILKSFISEANASMYLKKIEKSLLIELKLYNTIATTAKNNDLKELAKKAISVIQKNITSIQKE